MHFKGQKAMGTNALFNHKKTTLDSMQGWGGSSGSQKHVKQELVWGTAAARTGAECLLREVGRWRIRAVVNENKLPFSQEQWNSFAWKKKSLLLSNMRSNTIKNSVVHTFLQLHDKLLILFNAALLATTSLLQSSAFLIRVRSISYLSDTGSALITLTQS